MIALMYSNTMKPKPDTEERQIVTMMDSNNPTKSVQSMHEGCTRVNMATEKTIVPMVAMKNAALCAAADAKCSGKRIVSSHPSVKIPAPNCTNRDDLVIGFSHA